MSLKGVTAFLWMSAAGIAAAQQNPAPVQPSSDSATAQSGAAASGAADQQKKPLTPEEERQREIRQLDPTDHNAVNSDAASPNAAAAEAEAKEKAAREADRPRTPDPEPLPGSIAASEKSTVRQGPDVVEDDQNAAQDQQYTGPAVLSRSYTINRPMVLENVKWVESAGVNAIYDSGLAAAALNPDGALSGGGNLYGVGITYGFRGRRLWRRDQIGIDLEGQYSRYAEENSPFNGQNSTLTLDYTHHLSRRLSVTFVGAGSIFSQNYNLVSSIANPAISVADINIASSPNIQIFDVTTKQASIQTNVTWQKSTRLSFNFGGTYFAVNRGGTPGQTDASGGLGLTNVTGEQAMGDVQYRLTYRTTLGAYYMYSYYVYPHGLNVTDVNTVGGTYSYAISRTMQLRLRGGVSSVESLGQEQVDLSPVIAALLGTSSGIIDAYHKARTSDISAELVKDFRNGRTASVHYLRGISPGNGIYLSSEQESIGASAAMRLFRRYTLTIGASRDSLSSVSQTVGKFIADSGTIALSRGFNHGVSLNFMGAYRYFDIRDGAPVRSEVRVQTGVSWSSENGRLWPF